ncbi:hypothetical protein [Stenotrophomonas terrae]|uniref:hypothetical protein n=1 Tax=Stenotrophomonas terrae TaxID=405446 RepID=UPI000AB7A8D0|nr:hypothetical protein [Stenotrophomonas terrae]
MSRSLNRTLILALTLALPLAAFAQGAPALKIDSAQVVGLTALLEAQPRHPEATSIRALLLEWEDSTTDAVDYVCPDVLAPIPGKGIANGPELLAQFIFGSAAFQVANPSQKGALQPSQLAGMRSMLKAYKVLLATDPGARIPRFDALAVMDAQGTLPAYLEPIVTLSCR